jgi:hypothetical protein
LIFIWSSISFVGARHKHGQGSHGCAGEYHTSAEQRRQKAAKSRAGEAGRET